MTQQHSSNSDDELRESVGLIINGGVIFTHPATVRNTNCKVDQIMQLIHARDKALIQRVEDEVIGPDEAIHYPYLVVGHKLGLEANVKQAKLIAACVNRLKHQQRTALNSLITEKDNT